MDRPSHEYGNAPHPIWRARCEREHLAPLNLEPEGMLACEQPLGGMQVCIIIIIRMLLVSPVAHTWTLCKQLRTAELCTALKC